MAGCYIQHYAFYNHGCCIDNIQKLNTLRVYQNAMVT